MKPNASKIFTTLFTLALLVPGVANAESKAPGVALVGASLSTGQAIIWDRTAEEYAVVRLGQNYRGATIKRILADRVVLLRGGALSEVRLSASPFYTGGPRNEQRGRPAGIVIASPGQAAPPPATPARPAALPAPAPAAVKAPVVAKAPAAKVKPAAAVEAPAKVKPVAAARAPAARAPAAKPAPAPATVKPASVTKDHAAAPASKTSGDARKVAVTMPRLRTEVSDFFRRKVSYRGKFSTNGMALSGVDQGSLLYRMGLRNGDRVASLNGWKLVSSDAAMDAYLSLQSGTQVDLIYKRAGKQRVLKLRLV